MGFHNSTFPSSVSMPKDESSALPSYEIFHAMLQEIQKYKWIESQNRGVDIGFETALTEWTSIHFPAWKKEYLLKDNKKASQNKTRLFL